MLGMPNPKNSYFYLFEKYSFMERNLTQTTDLEIKKSLGSCPGDTIQEHIDEIGMSQAELAERLGRAIPKLNELIKGKTQITKETATKLEYVLGVQASFWLNLEGKYQDEVLKIARTEKYKKAEAAKKS